LTKKNERITKTIYQLPFLYRIDSLHPKLVQICNPCHTNEESAIQFMMLKQLQLKDSFSGCLKATAMEKGKKTSIAVCFS